VIDSGPVGDLPWMVPGYRPWSIQIDNRTRTNLSSRAFAGSTRAEGCWYGADLRTASDPLPVQPVPVAMGGRSGAFMTGQRLRGASCGDNPGVFYIHVEPAGAPGQRQVVQLRGTASGIEVVDQVGAGRFTVHTEREGASVRVVVSERHDPPSVVSAPVLEAARLTPAPAAQHVPTDDVNDPSRPVHRFTLSGVSWNVPGAASDLTEATLPLPTAEGSVDGESWDSLGTVAAPTAPTRDGDRVTMGTAVFDWQTSAGATKDYRYFRVNAEGSASNVIDTAGLSSPAPAPTVSKLQITGTASPRANGLDQTPLRISLFGDGSQALDTVQHASWYERVYFRDPTTKALITGLGDPANPSQLMIFSLQAGQYANDGVTAAGASMAAYFSTRTSQQARSVMAVLKLEGTVDSKSLRSATSSFRAESKSLLGEGTGANGLVVTPCAEGVCTLADPQVGPALHSLTGTSVSVQFRTRVIPGAGSLPLTQPERNGEDLRLVSDHLTIRGSRATLSNPNVFGTGTMIATNLVTHGDRLTLENHYAK
ncbi:hypothetical protein, partial [Agromyces aerolatus]|uniref:hypothetical protein n=1 Tax=Agromyces sp. LY-1074 TaxID=3074080 RepID=UPI00285C06C0